MTLRKGSRGEAVRKLQAALIRLSYLKAGTADGDFGSRTKSAVVAFQQGYLVDGIADPTTSEAIKAAVHAWEQRDQDHVDSVPRGLTQIEARFGIIEFAEAEGGSIEITNDWADKHIVEVNLPVVGVHLVHRELASVIGAVLRNIKDKGLDGKIKQFGIWCPRHKMHDPSRGLSTHSWALACDINWATNPVGRVGDMDPGIVDSFERYGFQWGGRWRHRDDMHYQYCVSY